MPWLVGTAFLHSVIIQERRGMLKVWNVILVVLAFLLGIFGTFLTRSGIVSSVHAFADSSMGAFFIVYMIVVSGMSFYLISLRLPHLRSDRPLDSILSRESAFLFNNLVLIVACFAVFWGTMFPVLSEWVQGTKITVGPPFFNNVNIPIGLLLLFLTGVGPLFAWRKTSLESLKKAFLWPVLLAAVCCSILLAFGLRSLYPLVSFTLCAFVLVTIFREFYQGAKVRAKNAGENFLRALATLTLKNKRRYGGYIVHFSIVLIFMGLTGNAFNEEATRQMKPGDEMTIGRYTLKMTDYQEGDRPNYIFGKVTLEAYRAGELLRILAPERRMYKAGDRQTTTEVELYSTPREDLYVVFAGTGDEGESFEITAHLNPLVWWVWFGAGVMFLGTMVTILPDRWSPFNTRRASAGRVGVAEESVTVK